MIKDGKFYGNSSDKLQNKTSKVNNKSNCAPFLLKSIEDESCIICMNAKRTYATIPCGHLKYCEECIKIILSK